MWVWILLSCAVAGGTCDASGLKKVVSAVSQVSPDHRGELAVVGVSEACAGAPAWIRDLSSAPPEYRPMLAAKGISEDPTAWASACPAENPFGALASAMQLTPTERGRHLQVECKIDWATADELAGARGDLLTAIVIADVLKAHRTERRLLSRAVAGL